MQSQSTYYTLSHAANTNQLLAKANALVTIAEKTDNTLTQHALLLSSVWFCQLGQISFCHELCTNVPPTMAKHALTSLKGNTLKTHTNPCADIAAFVKDLSQAGCYVPELQRLLQLHEQHPCLAIARFIVADGKIPNQQIFNTTHNDYIATDTATTYTSTHHANAENFTVQAIQFAYENLLLCVEESRETNYQW